MVAADRTVAQANDAVEVIIRKGDADICITMCLTGDEKAYLSRMFDDPSRPLDSNRVLAIVFNGMVTTIIRLTHEFRDAYTDRANAAFRTKREVIDG